MDTATQSVTESTESSPSYLTSYEVSLAKYNKQEIVLKAK